MATQEIGLKIGGQTKRSRFSREVVVGFDALPEASREFIIRYGLKQYLADGTASAEDETGFNAGIDGRLAKLQTGNLGRASASPKSRPDSEEGRALSLIKAHIRKKLAEAGRKAEKDAIDKAAQALLTAEGGKSFREEAKRQLAAESSVGSADDMLKDLGL